MTLFGMRAAIIVAGLILAGGAQAQQAGQSFIQIEAQPTLSQAEQSARQYATRLPDVLGFSIGGGWYGIALGPYTEGDARARLAELRRTAAIPRDSYVSDGASFRAQFWPVGAQPLTTTLPLQPQAVLVTEEEEVTPATLPDETPREARASERLLTRDQREELQRALEWEGFYRSGIDGAFGPGTRRAMTDWQIAQGYDATGVLTTRQRAELIDGYTSVFDALGLGLVVDDTAGIEVTLPTGLVRFDKFEAPFVHYAPSTDRDVRVLLISQPGTDTTLGGLYEIMQTLAIVPLEGERSRSRNSFTLTGQNDRLHSYTYAAQSGGEIKGFTLVYPPAEAKIMARVIDDMRSSFAPIQGVVMDPALVETDPADAVDLIAGLEIRRPITSRSGFYVDGSGRVISTDEVLGDCGRYTLDEIYEVKVAAQDAATGLVLFAPTDPLAPADVATLAPAQIRAEVAVAGYSYEGALGAPTLTFGTVEALTALDGADGVDRLGIDSLAGDAGGPVFAGSGDVVGMLLPKAQQGSRVLPDGVGFAADAQALGSFLAAQGVSTPAAAAATATLAPEDLVRRARDMTVLVSCWN